MDTGFRAERILDTDGVVISIPRGQIRFPSTDPPNPAGISNTLARPMTLISRKLPAWMTGGIALAAWIAALATATSMIRTVGLWDELLASSRFQAALIFYSLPFVVIGAALIALGRCTPQLGFAVAGRRICMGLCILALGVAGFFLVVVGLGFDAKFTS